jgi:hypothetical protein
VVRDDRLYSGASSRYFGKNNNLVIKSLPRLIIFFLGIPYKLISFLTVYKALLASLSIGVCFYIGVTIGVTGRT